MKELNRLIGQVEDWTEELLLRGTAQFALEDARRLERLADDAARLGMELLERLLRQLAGSGERSLLGADCAAGEVERAFFRLSGYMELARQSANESGPGLDAEEPGEAEEAD
ncbi:hypothetical protein [Saccharibacillus brassicae]|uniref:Uncharacterized protein n=1 Tax=Saccharibacillus brassicae TaxID=2583377 RepID=A0A4Y6UVL5_SACBS|nr:hypothetical protein [Saccharibacillus brassicae]QDH21782.1 hypothetical protein FFV09_13560 [Saccharibacillus brassicae]